MKNIVCRVTVQLWPLLENTLATFQTEDRAVEKLCRCWKYSMRAADKSWAPLFQPLLEMLTKSFALHPRAGFLYTLSTVIDMGYQNAEHHPVFRASFEAMAQTTFALLQRNFSDLPDVVEDFFDLATRLLRCLPDYILASPLLPIMWECAAAGLYIQHHEALGSLCTFLGSTIDTAFKLSRGVSAGQGAGPHRKVVEQLLVRHSGAILEGLVAGLAGAQPADRLSLMVPLFESIIMGGGEAGSVKPLLLQALAKTPDTHGPTKDEFVAQVVSPGDAWPSRIQRGVYSLSEAFRRGIKEGL